MMKPTTIAEVQEFVRAHPHVWVRAGGSKKALAAPPVDSALLDLTGLSGMQSYEPEEFTFTALAGTRLSVIDELLRAHHQYLPFDPVLVGGGATLGGTVAAGLNGPGRYRFGGIRDFILGVRYIDSTGEVVRGGGQVVKNAAGFDLPKLMVGSLGQYGVLAEITFKVFPRPEAYLTLQFTTATMAEAMRLLNRIYTVPLDIDALDMTPQDNSATKVWVRLAGPQEVLIARAERVQKVAQVTSQIITGEAEATLWQHVREFDWVPPEWSLVKIPLVSSRLMALEEVLSKRPGRRRYSAAGNVAWLATPEVPNDIAALLSSLGLSGLKVWGGPGPVLMGLQPGLNFSRRVKMALDPQGRFLLISG